MKCILMIIFIMSSIFAQAEVKPWSVGLLMDYRLFEDLNGEMTEKTQFWGPSVSYQYRNYESLLEFEMNQAHFSTEGDVSIRTQNYEAILWNRYHFYNVNHHYVYAGLGLGYNWQSIDVSMSEETAEYSSQRSFAWGLQMGWKYLFPLSWSLALEPRLIKYPSSDTTFLSATLRMGYHF